MFIPDSTIRQYIVESGIKMERFPAATCDGITQINDMDTGWQISVDTSAQATQFQGVDVNGIIF